MRILFLLLVAANLAFFAWLRFMAPADPAISVTRRSTAVWMSSSVGTNSNAPSASSPST